MNDAIIRTPSKKLASNIEAIDEYLRSDPYTTDEIRRILKDGRQEQADELARRAASPYQARHWDN